ncbi:MAG: hypothetical protein KDA24_28880 [Deltaproteobacteria bacterium]|nr:hypothetical protein [Deltaproteobacteria bacterium]
MRPMFLILWANLGFADPLEDGKDAVDAVHVVVTADAIAVDGKKVVTLDTSSGISRIKETDLKAHLIEPLFDHLNGLRGETSGGQTPVVTLEALPETRFHVLRAVMSTAGQAELGAFKFVVTGMPVE